MSVLSLDASLLRALRPPARHPLSQWCEAHREVVRGAKPGRWRNRNAPHLREILDALNDPLVERVTIMSATQIGKTELLLNWIVYLMSEDPGDTLLVMGSEDAAREFSEERLWPTLLACEPTRARFAGRPKADHKRLSFTTGEMNLDLAWAGSPVQLASRPIKNLCLDEVDKYPLLLRREGDPMSLAIERTKTYDDRRIVACSSPTTREGLIFRAWEQSDQREWHVPCLSCGRYQRLTFDRFTWPERPDDRSHREHADWLAAQDAVRFPCEACGHEHGEPERLRMLERGVWVPAGCSVDAAGVVHGLPATPSRHRGYRVTTLGSTTVSRSWSLAAAKFVEAQGSLGELRNFRNGWLAEIWEDRTAALTESRFAALQGEHPRRTCPVPGVVLTLGADVQADLIYWVVRAWGPHEESWLVDAGSCERLEQLAQVIRFGWPTWTLEEGERAERRRVRLACIDSGYRTKEIYEFCRTDHLTLRPIKGMDHLSGQIWKGTAAETTARGRALQGGLRLFLVDTSALKDKMIRLQTLPENVPGGWWTFDGIDDLYVRHQLGEHKVKRVDNRGRVTEIWAPRSVGAPNHWFDAEVYALAAAEMLGVWTLTPQTDLPPAPPPRAAAGTGRVPGRSRHRRSW